MLCTALMDLGVGMTPQTLALCTANQADPEVPLSAERSGAGAACGPTLGKPGVTAVPSPARRPVWVAAGRYGSPPGGRSARFTLCTSWQSVRAPPRNSRRRSANPREVSLTRPAYASPARRTSYCGFSRALVDGLPETSLSVVPDARNRLLYVRLRSFPA